LTWTPSNIRWYVADLERWSGDDLPIMPGVYWWIPLTRAGKIVDGEWTDVTEPMFPGYALGGSRHGWRHVDATGVPLLRVGRHPTELTQAELDRIRVAEAVVHTHEPNFAQGQRVRVRAGARSSFAGLEGAVVRMVSVRGGKQAVVALDLYGECQRDVVVAADHLEAPW